LELNIEYRELSGLIPYARNARKHSQNQVSQIAASIKEFGFNSPVLLKDDSTIIAGHGRVMAAEKLGLKKVPCIYLKHLTPTQAKAYGIVDNQLTLNSEWDNELLKLEVLDLKENDVDIDILGFKNEELSQILEIMPEDAYGKEFDESCADDVEFLECPECGHKWAK